MPRVSVILPNYNYARYLKERIRSILRQTMTDFELLYLDDASKDESNLVAKAFSDDPRMKMHLFTENSGKVYQRWNDGAALATGEWLWFAGADDTAHPQFLERLLQNGDKYPNAAILYSRPLLMDGNGKITDYDYCRGGQIIRDHFTENYYAPTPAETAFLADCNYFTTASSMLIRRSAFEREERFDIRLWQAADWHLYLRLMRENGLFYSTEPLSCYRVHQNTVTKNTKRAVYNLECAYCVAHAYLGMKEGQTGTAETKETVLRRLKVMLFEMFADPEFKVPPTLEFAAKTIYEAVPDKRLLVPA